MLMWSLQRVTRRPRLNGSVQHSFARMYRSGTDTILGSPRVHATVVLTDLSSDRLTYSPQRLPNRLDQHLIRYFSASNRTQPPKGSLRSADVSNINVANALTLARLVAAPMAAGFVLHDEHSFALATVAFAGISDVLDGWVARRFNLKTTLGSYLDPLADKFLVACASGALAVQGVLPVWLVVIVVGRDAGLVIGAVLQRKTRDAFSFWKSGSIADLPPLAMQPLPSSKLNTVMQIVLTVTGIAYAGQYSVISEGVLHYMCIATAVTTAYSAAEYGYIHVVQPRFRKT